jgi:hypothetical protein
MKIAISIAIVAWTTVAAHAQRADAEIVFREGKKLMEKGDISAACEKFETSERLEPALGTELNLADCREKNGQHATAWAMFLKAAQTAKRKAGNEARAAEAKRRAAALEPKLVYLTIAVPESARVDGLVVRRNSVVLDEGLYDQPVPVDPDDYKITAEAPGHESWHKKISVAKKNKTLEVPALAPSEAPPAPEPPAPERREPTPAPQSSAARTAAVVLGVLGVAAGATGIGFGVHASSLEEQSDAICPTVRCNNPTAIDLNHSARTNGLVANIGMIGGGVMVAGAIALWIVDRRGHHGVAIVPAPSGISIAGTY